MRRKSFVALKHPPQKRIQWETIKNINGNELHHVKICVTNDGNIVPARAKGKHNNFAPQKICFDKAQAPKLKVQTEYLPQKRGLGFCSRKWEMSEDIEMRTEMKLNNTFLRVDKDG